MPTTQQLSTEKGSAVIFISTKPTASPRGGGGRGALLKKFKPHRGLDFLSGRTGANRALFSLWLLSLLSKRKRESDNVPQLGKAERSFSLCQRENAIISLVLCTLAPGKVLYLALWFKRQGFAVALHLRKPNHIR